MTFARKTLAIALATVSLNAAVVGTPASAHPRYIGIHIGPGGARPAAIPSANKVCPNATHLGPYGHYCWANGNSYGF